MVHNKLAVGILAVLLVGMVAAVFVSASHASSAPILAVSGPSGSPRTASLELLTSAENGLTDVARELVAQAVSDWQQVNSDGFGDQQNIEVSALEAFGGFLYAGTHNPADPLQTVDGAQIFRSSGGAIWTAVTDPGFGNSHDTAPPAILDLTVFSGYLYASTGRGNAAQIWRSPNGVNWMRVVNAGPDSASTITVIDTLPPEVTYSDASGSGWNCGHSGGTVTCISSSLPAGAESEIVITVTAPGASGMITNTASIASQILDPDPSNNNTETTTRVGFVYGVYLPAVLRQAPSSGPTR